MNISNSFDAYAKPPKGIKDVYKTFQKLDVREVDEKDALLDLNDNNGKNGSHLKDANLIQLPTELREAFKDFLGLSGGPYNAEESSLETQAAVFEVTSVPGLFVYPSLLPPEVQISLLDKLLHRDLVNHDHQTNVHMHYQVPHPNPREDRSRSSYFDTSSSSLIFYPKTPSIHKPIGTHQFLNKKLRWMTLGGQYDWTNKVYPSGQPPPFPPDIKQLTERIFPMKGEAAIVNLYSPGDTLSLHRDVSEVCDQPLVSISLGCDGIFVVGLEEASNGDQPRVATIRLRSGDAVLMSGESRYAWHGVPKVLEGTCPEWMQDWPYYKGAGNETSERFEHCKGWMKGKRINLNVRQMFA